jgi:hypothetical protein
MKQMQSKAARFRLVSQNRFQKEDGGSFQVLDISKDGGDSNAVDSDDEDDEDGDYVIDVYNRDTTGARPGVTASLEGGKGVGDSLGEL